VAPQLVFEWIEVHKTSWTVKRMCKTLKVSTSGYYEWAKSDLTKAEIRRAELLAEIKRIQQENPCYGIRRIYECLRRRGFLCSYGLVHSICKDNGIRTKAKHKPKPLTDSNHKEPVAENLLQQNFAAETPNQKYVGDITYIATCEGFLYLSGVLDLFDSTLVGWKVDDTMHRELVMGAFRDAVKRHHPQKGLIFHSDRGSQYASHDFRELLQQTGAIQSMSGKGNCYDNARMESFFATLKKECVYYYKTYLMPKSEVKTLLFWWIECYYNRQRLHSANGYRPPAEKREEYFTKQAVA
jgi:putative transposase